MSNQISDSILDRIKVDPSERNILDQIEDAGSGITDSEIDYLAQLNAQSGVKFEYSSRKPISDIPSTGGPSSLVYIVLPPDDCPRNRFAKIAAEVALRKFNRAGVNEFSSYNLKDLIRYPAIRYQHYFVTENFKFGIALADSKVQAIASAVTRAILKGSQCWNIHPGGSNKFTEGTGETTMYSLNLTHTKNKEIL